jgi:hypothetical protein
MFIEHDEATVQVQAGQPNTGGLFLGSIRLMQEAASPGNGI